MSKFKKHPTALQKLSKLFARCDQESSKKAISLIDAKVRVDEALRFLNKSDNFFDEKASDAIAAIGSIPRERTGLQNEDDIPADKIATYQSKVRSVGKYLSHKHYTELFVKITNSIQQTLQESESEKKSQALLCLLALFDGFHCYSDQCHILARQFGELGGPEALLQFMTSLQDPATVFDEDVRILAETTYQTSIIILHNCIRLHADNRLAYRKANAVVVLTKLTQASGEQFKNFRVLLVLILAYIVDERESEALTKSEGYVRILTKLLNEAVQSDGHFAKLTDGNSSITFSAVDLLGCLNRLAVNDANNVEIAQSSGISAIIRMLQPDFSEEERKVATETLWKLSFVDSIKKNCEVKAAVNTLQSLSSSENKSIREASSFALWEIQDHQKHSHSPNTDDLPPSYQESIGTPGLSQSSGHVMISYQWDSQPRAIYIRDKLLQSGYNVWLDVDKMRGDILVAMADAVERADVIIICMTEMYKDSPNCRSEASYASKMKKHIIPVLMEADYEPDGWLGLLLGTKLYYKFSTDDEMTANIQGLIKEIGNRGRADNSAVAENADVAGPVTSTTQNVPDVSESETETPRSGATEWSKEKVQSWFQEIGLPDLCTLLDFCEGEHLQEMYDQYQKSPDVFRSEMKEDLELNFRDFLKLTTGLKVLFESVS